MTNVVQQLYAVGIDENIAFNMKKIINPMMKENHYASNFKGKSILNVIIVYNRLIH